ncbi:hypothetical protein [Bradyrhizobium sp. S3.9.1]|uniref:hypothetical protein n=1 Tax=Bradyrhizobium sp. S3.9.1 TaxID=3156431 RepID=UPI00339B7500
MARVEIEFSWPVAERYEIARPKKGAGNTLLTSGINEPRLVAVGPLTNTRMLDWDIYKWVAKRPKTIEAYAEFAHRFGLLGDVMDPPGESYLSTWRETIDGLSKLRKLCEGAKVAGAGMPFTVGSEVRVLVRRRADGSPTLAYHPKSLRSALMLQCAQDLTSGAAIRDCLQCGQWFTVGGAHGRRSHAQFCSQECKIKYMNDRNRARAKETGK